MCTGPAGTLSTKPGHQTSGLTGSVGPKPLPENARNTREARRREEERDEGGYGMGEGLAAVRSGWGGGKGRGGTGGKGSGEGTRKKTGERGEVGRSNA